MPQKAKVSDAETRRLAELLQSLPVEQRRSLIAELSDQEAETLLYDWELWARDKQLPPDVRFPSDARAQKWSKWIMNCGRGFGKTRAGAQQVIRWAKQNPGCRILIVGRTNDEARFIAVEGESGILACSPPDFRPDWEPGNKQLTWPNGAVARVFGAEKPDAFRGQQAQFVWADEVCSWTYLDEAWANIVLGHRLGKHTQLVITTTPRPIPFLKRMLKDPDAWVVQGSSLENLGNLADNFRREVLDPLMGTRLGRQEIEAQLLDDTPGALWNRDLIERCRYSKLPSDGFIRIAVGVDPSITGMNDETGIIVCGLGLCDCSGTPEVHGFILDDCSLMGQPSEWAQAAVTAYHKWMADVLVAETNQGGLMVRDTVFTCDDAVNYKGVHASKGKIIRAEPIANLFERGKCHFTRAMPELEDQLCSYAPGMKKSPDRLDALVWSFTELFLDSAHMAAPAVYSL